MECPECLTQNPEIRKFCRECGNKLLLICPNCSTDNIPGDKFCGECGYNLLQPKDSSKELTFDDKLDKIQRYLPEGITEKILSQRGKIEGERKQVTVMFCDLEGFTPLVEQLGVPKKEGGRFFRLCLKQDWVSQDLYMSLENQFQMKNKF